MQNSTSDALLQLADHNASSLVSIQQAGQASLQAIGLANRSSVSAIHILTNQYLSLDLIGRVETVHSSVRELADNVSNLNASLRTVQPGTSPAGMLSGSFWGNNN